MVNKAINFEQPCQIVNENTNSGKDKVGILQFEVFLERSVFNYVLVRINHEH